KNRLPRKPPIRSRFPKGVFQSAGASKRPHFMFAFLARLILFLVAISVIRSVVRFVQRTWMGVVQPRQHVTGPAAGAPATTMLQQDPVCGTYVAIDSSLKKIIHGRVLHFCSAECRDKYRS